MATRSRSAALANGASKLVALVRTGAHLSAIPLADVIEILRPLRVAHLASAPPFVRGVSIIRGAPVPVVDLALLLGDRRGQDARWLVVRSGERRVALSVDEMLGVRELPAGAMAEVPPLLGRIRDDAVSGLGALERELVLTLDSARAVPPSVWQAMEQVAR